MMSSSLTCLVPPGCLTRAAIVLWHVSLPREDQVTRRRLLPRKGETIIAGQTNTALPSGLSPFRMTKSSAIGDGKCLWQLRGVEWLLRSVEWRLQGTRSRKPFGGDVSARFSFDTYRPAPATTAKDRIPFVSIHLRRVQMILIET
jgi:hypothetical protein